MSTAPPKRPVPAPGSLSGLVQAGVAPALPSVGRRARRRRRLTRTLLVAGLGLVVVLLLLATSGGGPRPPSVTVRPTLATSVTVPQPPATAGGPATQPLAATLPWPRTGQAAVAIPELGYLAESGPEKAVPVASLTKMMTAYVVLHDHPLSPGHVGPRITITTAEADNFGYDTVTDQASVQLAAGEVLTESQLLEGLLVHSANDFAFVLATWDAGSVNAFVAKMNADAAALGLHHSHFADASGFSNGSVSTAVDLLRLASIDMADPTFAAIVRMPSVDLPVAGVVQSYTPLVGTTPGVVGVKSGFTTAAGGGDVLAYQTSVGGHPFVVLAAVISQEGPTVLFTAGEAALALAGAAASHVVADTVSAPRTTVGRVTAAGHVVDAVTASSATVLGMAGDTVRQSVVLRPPALGAPAGTTIGTASFGIGTQSVSVPVETTAPLR